MPGQTLRIHGARFVVTVDEQRRIIKDGSILVEGQRITRVGKAIEMEEATSASDFSINYMKEQLENWKVEQSPAGDVLKAAPEE